MLTCEDCELLDKLIAGHRKTLLDEIRSITDAAHLKLIDTLAEVICEGVRREIDAARGAMVARPVPREVAGDVVDVLHGDGKTVRMALPSLAYTLEDDITHDSQEESEGSAPP